MLCLGRKKGQTIRIVTSHGDVIVVHVMDIDRGKARLGIEADRSVSIMRSELIPPANGRNG